jgi:hypothetical protein
MKLVGIVSTAVLSLMLGVAAPVLAQQEQHDQQDEQKAKPAQQEEKKAQPEKSATKEGKGAQQKEKKPRQEEKNAQEHHAQPPKPAQHVERAAGNGRRIPQARYKANFGREHTFRVSQSEYSGGRRFQYGGYWFGFVDPWPSNWLYTQDVFVVEINGAYYLCNPSFPGVNIALNVTL